MSKQRVFHPLVAVSAVACGLACGYAIWGWPTNWYSLPDVASLSSTPQNDLIRYGQQLIVNTAPLIGKSATDPSKHYAGNDLACTNCHMSAGLKPFAAPLVSTFGSYPMLANDQVLTLTERINGCMVRSMNGKPLPEDSREMEGLMAYIQYIGRGTPESVRIAGMGLKPLKVAAQKPDALRGHAVYQKTCAECHKANGQGELKAPPGVGYSIPPLWGDGSFNQAAGMNKVETAAAFIRANMPYLTDYTNPALTEQEAWDVAAYVTSQPRPGGPAPIVSK